ncbi:hypothetical protein SCALM49S_01410 [Streptomyces californicus]
MASSPVTSPSCTWVVEPLRVTAWPTVASPAREIACVEPLYRFTSLGCAVSEVYLTRP